jgi:dCMP deaminase
MRDTWDQTWAALARTMARRTLCVRHGVGAVVVTADQRVAATGYNGPPAGAEFSRPCDSWCERGAASGPRPPAMTDCAAVHAEMNALLHSSRAEREGGTLYVTGWPCWQCALAVANSGVATLVSVDPDLGPGRRQAGRVARVLRESGLEVRQVWRETGAVDDGEPR